MKTLRVSSGINRHVRQEGFAYRNEGQLEKPLGSRMLIVNSPESYNHSMSEELRPFFGQTLMPSILDKTFKGNL
jgi:hypothetical protein